MFTILNTNAPGARTQRATERPGRSRQARKLGNMQHASIRMLPVGTRDDDEARAQQMQLGNDL